MSEIKFNIGLDPATRGCLALFLLLFKFSPGTLLFRIESIIYIFVRNYTGNHYNGSLLQTKGQYACRTSSRHSPPTLHC